MCRRADVLPGTTAATAVQGPARFGLANIEFLTPGERGDLPAGQLAPFPTSWPYNKRRSVEN